MDTTACSTAGPVRPDSTSPRCSLGLWHNFGGDQPFEEQRPIIHRAFDLGVTRFDLANNYGPPYGSAEENFGRVLAGDLRRYRDELVISTKAGYDMWPGPYGERWGSRKYLLASLDQAARMGLDYVDIFYSHRSDPDTPLEKRSARSAAAVEQGGSLRQDLSRTPLERTLGAVRILPWAGRAPLLMHQPSYSILNRWIEDGLLDVLGREGCGFIVFSPLAQGLLTDRYLHGIPEGSRASRKTARSSGSMLSVENLAKVRSLSGSRSGGDRRSRRWPSRGPCAMLQVTSTLVGASSVAQLEDNIVALENLTSLRRGTRRDRRVCDGRWRGQWRGSRAI